MKSFLKIATASILIAIMGYSLLNGESSCGSCSTCVPEKQCEK